VAWPVFTSAARRSFSTKPCPARHGNRARPTRA
jgi:hypothetical protein